MTDIARLLADCNAHGIRLALADGDGLAIDAPQVALTPDLIDRIKSHKADLLGVLRPAGAPGGKRKAIRLGKVSQRTAEQVKFRVERLLEAKLTGHSLDADMARWVADLPGPLADKLARVRLIPKRELALAATLERFIEGYIKRRTDTSPNTRRIWRQTATKLAKYFGPQKPLDEITRGDAKDWRLSLISCGLADASVRKHCGFAKHFFAQAVDHELIPSNPFGKLVSSPVGNEARQFFVTHEATDEILDAAPDAEWRLIIALSRYGGLRCPSEHLSLRWEDVDWANKRLQVTSPKTARHVGHESRIIPIFPELMPHLEAAWEAASPGAEYLINRYRNKGSNMRTQMTRIVKRAGLTPWPRIFHNLRSSRQTELEETFPSHVVCKWIGNSPQVARKHYLQTTDEHFERAIKGGAESGAQVAQNEAQQAHAACRSESQEVEPTQQYPLAMSEVTPSEAIPCDVMAR